MFVITSKLPDGKNYFCRFVQDAGLQFVEWDTDISYAKQYPSRYAAKMDLKAINEETATIEHLPKDAKLTPEMTN
jgi:hypothetical protein